MPAKSEKQRRAACAELGRRKKGKGRKPGMPFAGAATASVGEFCKIGPKKKKRR